MHTGWIVCCASLALIGCQTVEAQTRPPIRSSSSDSGAGPVTADVKDVPDTHDEGVRRFIGGVRVGVPNVVGGEGTIVPLSVQRQLSARTRDFLYCHDRALRDRTALEGRIDLHVAIGADGRVGTVSADGMPGVPEFTACVARALRALRLAVPSGGAVEVSVPLHFAPTVDRRDLVSPLRPPGPRPTRTNDEIERERRLRNEWGVTLYGASAAPMRVGSD